MNGDQGFKVGSGRAGGVVRRSGQLRVSRSSHCDYVDCRPVGGNRDHQWGSPQKGNGVHDTELEGLEGSPEIGATATMGDSQIETKTNSAHLRRGRLQTVKAAEPSNRVGKDAP
jgi:hypothetical protein